MKKAMEYTVVLYKKFMDGTTPKKAMYTFDALSKAEAEYHKNLSTIGSDNLKSIMCMVIAEDGTQHFCRYWKADEVVEETA
jgi:hypothetical protein